jgi:hypothetical protein
MSHDVFICHSSKDRTIANAICSTLEQHRIRCWIAPRDVLPGSDYGGAIVEAISSSRLTVLVFSRSSNDSAHVRREIERTISHGIPVLPFRVEEVTPSPGLEYFISDAHWLDAMTPPLEQHLDHLVGTIRVLLDRETSRAPAPPPLPPAPLPGAPLPGISAPDRGAQTPAVPWVTTPAPVPVARPRPLAPILAAAGAGVIAVLLLLAGGVLLLGARGQAGPGGTPRADALPSPSQAAVASAPAVPSDRPGALASPSGLAGPGTTTSATAGPTPSAATTRLAAAMPTSLACDEPEAGAEDDAALASVFCYVGNGTVGSIVYRLYPSLADLQADYASWLSYYEVRPDTAGSCAAGDVMESDWSYETTPSVTEGRYFCVLDDGKANLYWTDEATLILGNIDGDDDVGLDVLYPTWATNAYDPVRP